MDIDLATAEERLASILRMKADADRSAESWRRYSRNLAEELDEARERYDALVAAIRERVNAACSACAAGVPFVTNEHGPLRPRGHARRGYCSADAMHEILAGAGVG